MTHRTVAGVAVLAFLAATAGAQITLQNTATSPTQQFITTVGTGITLDTAVFQLGNGSVARAASASNASYVPTGFVVNPSTGWTIQFWFRPQGAPGGAAWYMFGDPSMVSPLGGPSGGAFRIFRDGVALANNLIVRGVVAQVVTTGAPLATGLNPQGWVHIALRYTGNSPPAPLPANELRWFINGVPNAFALQPGFNWGPTTPNMSIVGYAGSTAVAGWGHYDDIRVDDSPRQDADILANFNVEATGPAVPNKVYLKCNAQVNPHVAFIGANGDPTGAATRLLSAGTPMEWGATSPGLPGAPASCIMNLNGPIVGTPGISDPYSVALRPAPAMPANHSTGPVPGLEVGHLFSLPPAPFSLAFPDGLGIGIITNVGIPIPYAYGGPNMTFNSPPVFNTGDRIDLQFVAVDTGWPNNIATTNRCTFVVRNCQPGPHVRVEARGNGAIQVTGFWEVHNKGTVSITQVKIDATTATGGATGFNPAGALNSGGTLQAGTSYRFGSNVFCGLTGGTPPGMFTCLTPGTPPCRGLQFDFNNFNPCTDVFLFDCDSAASNLNGNAYIGSTVTVTFFDNTVLTGPMVADPGDPFAAVFEQ